MTNSQVASSERMQCMEVWGGNSPVDRDIATVGLQVWLHSRPYEHAEKGGDVYYVSSCASGRITRLLLADVSGHGERVATIASGLRDLMRRNINLISQIRFMREMNRQFSEQPSRTGFATALVCTFFAPTRSLQFCNAGHPAPMLYRAAEGRWASAEELASVDRGRGFSDTPLGVVEGADYSRFETKLAHGDMMLCVSDAFTESLDSEGKLLGADGLMQRVEALDASDPTQIIPQLLDQISQEHAGNLSQDDATALLFRADGSSVSLKNNLLAPFRLMSPVRDLTMIVS